MNNSYKLSYNYLNIITAFYVTIKLTAFLTTYKIIQLDSIAVNFGVIIIPLWFLTGDVIAEVYGYKIAKRLIWLSLACQIFMIFTSYASSKIPSPHNLEHQSQIYKEIFSILTLGSISNSIGIIIGALVNARIITLLKSTLNNKHFIMRCFLANAIGELVFTTIAYSAGFFETPEKLLIIKLMLTSYLVKIIISPFLIIPAAIISAKLKTLENASHSSVYTKAGISKNLIRENNSIIKLKEDDAGSSFFTKCSLEMPIIHELGKLSVEYKNVNLKFGEFKPGIYIESYEAKNQHFFVCLSGEIRITDNNGRSKILKKSDIIFFEESKFSKCSIEILEESRVIIINL